MSIVKFIKSSLNQHKANISRWLYLNGIPFNVSTFPGFWALHEKHYNNYTVLIRITFNENVANDYWRIFITCAEKLTRRIQQHHSEPFIHVMHDMVTFNNRKYYLGASVSFMVYFDLHRLTVILIPSNVSHSSN